MVPLRVYQPPWEPGADCGTFSSTKVINFQNCKAVKQKTRKQKNKNLFPTDTSCFTISGLFPHLPGYFICVPLQLGEEVHLFSNLHS